MNARHLSRAHAYDAEQRHAGMVYVLMLVVALAFGGFVWQIYSAPDIPRIAAPAEPYKVEPPPEQAAAPDAGELAMAEALPPATADAAGPASAASGPAFASNGPYVVQLAALQSEPAVGVAWQRLSSRAPQLFGPATLDVERADLGPRGIYYRVRAGYFADSGQAAQFCERVRQMGQDCIVARR